MKVLITPLIALSIALSTIAQDKPGKPQDNGLIPRSDTFYVNLPSTINNNKTESLGVSIARNGNVIIGWEDDGEGLKDLAAVWTLFDSSGKWITPDTQIKAADGATATARFLSFFRADGSAIPGNTSWGPKIKANLFGDGIGMGATSYGLGAEVPEFAAINLEPSGDAGDFPGVQLLTNDGKPVAILTGLSDADADSPGDVRIGDWDYLSNGNVVIVGESRQRDDLVSRWKGAAPGNHAVYRIVDATGKEVRALGLVSETADPSEIWHGVGVTKNGFAVRFAQGGRTKVRLFDNSGNPLGPNIDIGTLTGKEPTAAGGRGDGTGFHGNGNDAYVLVSSAPNEASVPKVWLTVLNADGTLRYSRVANDDIEASNTERVDAAIDAAGRVVVVFGDTSAAGGPRVIQARVFDAKGQPIGKSLVVSEKETVETATAESRRPRVAMRDGLVAIVWESLNNPQVTERLVAARLFNLATPLPSDLASAKLTRIVPDKTIFETSNANLNNWEPFASVIGNSVFVVEANTFAENSAEHQRYAVAFQPVTGGAPKIGDAFFGDDGQPFRGQVNASRQNGNPGRVAGDKRPGAVNFIAGGEASPHVVAAFQSDNRWKTGVVRADDARYVTAQIHTLDLSSLSQKPLSKVFDPIHGRLTAGESATTPEVGRFGGELVGLDNGNFLIVADDRSNLHAPARSATAVIVAPDGKIVKETFVIAQGEIWSNVAAYRGGFAARVGGVIYFFDNDGNLKGQVGQGDDMPAGVAFDGGRGDGTRLAAHINSPYVFLAGTTRQTVDATPEPINYEVVRIAAWDSRTQKLVAVGNVSELSAARGGTDNVDFNGDFDRVNLAADALDRVAVAFEVKPTPEWEQMQTAMRVLAFDGAAKSFTALTPSFFAFVNHGQTGFRTFRPSVAMTTKEILVAAKGEINSKNDPALAPDTLPQTTFYTVFSHPDPKPDTTRGLMRGLPAEDGTMVAGYQDDFAGATRDPNWKARGPGGDLYRQEDGLLRVTVRSGDPNHLLYEAPGYDNTVQEVLARIRVTAFGVNQDGPRGGIGVGVSSPASQGINLHFRNFNQDGVNGRQFKLLDDNRAWGPAGLKIDWMTNQWYWLRLRQEPNANGGTNDVFGKVWVADGSTPEPENWQLTWNYTPGRSTRTGFAGIVGSSIDGISAFEVDYILIKASGLPNITVNIPGNTPPPTTPSFRPIVRAATAGRYVLEWVGAGVLEQADAITGPWTPVANGASPFTINATGTGKFYRIRP